jgi:hypothetical protein
MPGLRLATANAITDCTALRISRGEMIHVMHEEHGLSDFFLKFLHGLSDFFLKFLLERSAFRPTWWISFSTLAAQCGFSLINCTCVTPGDLLARPLHEVDRSLPGAPKHGQN